MSGKYPQFSHAAAQVALQSPGEDYQFGSLTMLARCHLALEESAQPASKAQRQPLGHTRIHHSIVNYILDDEEQGAT